ncbi:molybdenum transporter, partial [Haloferax sp. Atlit-6N]
MGAVVGATGLAGCSQVTGGEQSQQAQADLSGETLTLTTTTSTYDTGLLDAIHTDFEEMYG